MADFSNVFESISFYGGVSSVSAAVDAPVISYFGGVGSDNSGITLSSFFPYALGITSCRPLGEYSFWLNKVWDPGGPKWVYWETVNGPDRYGREYPDPFQTGFVGTDGFRVSRINYVDGQLVQLYPQDVNYDG